MEVEDMTPTKLALIVAQINDEEFSRAILQMMHLMSYPVRSVG